MSTGKVLGIAALVVCLAFGGCAALISALPDATPTASVAPSKPLTDEERVVKLSNNVYKLVDNTFSAGQLCYKRFRASNAEGSATCSIFKSQFRNQDLNEVMYAGIDNPLVTAELRRQGKYDDYKAKLEAISLLNQRLD